MPQEFYFTLQETTLLQFDFQFKFLQPLEDFVEVRIMIGDCISEHDNVIQIYVTSFPN